MGYRVTVKRHSARPCHRYGARRLRHCSIRTSSNLKNWARESVFTTAIAIISRLVLHQLHNHDMASKEPDAGVDKASVRTHSLP